MVATAALGKPRRQPLSEPGRLRLETIAFLSNHPGVRLPTGGI
jgi:hypothetical protein